MDRALHVVKIGGKLINDQSALGNFLDAFGHLPNPKILVHGGGHKATELSALLGIDTRMVEGRRITSRDSLEVAIMVFAGLINKQIVAAVQRRGIDAIGLCGADGDIIRATKRPVGEIDYGYVGDITRINVDRFDSLLSRDIVPVINAITHDGEGQLLNTNADTIASEIAINMSRIYHVKLSFCFEYPGVLYDLDTPDLVMNHISEGEFINMKTSGSINSGMIPKLTNGFQAVKKGVQEVTICGTDNLVSKERATVLTL